MTPNFVKKRGAKSNNSSDEVWCFQHNESNGIIANEQIGFFVGKTGSRASEEKIVRSDPLAGSGGTATIKNGLNTPLAPQS